MCQLGSQIAIFFDFYRLKTSVVDNIKIIIRHFARVAFGTTASQFLLAVSIHKHLLTSKNVGQNFVENS